MPKHQITIERESSAHRGYNAWRDACTSRGLDARVDQRLLWASYVGFCKGSYIPLGRRIFSRWLAEDGVTFRASHGTRWAYGVALRPEAESGLAFIPRPRRSKEAVEAAPGDGTDLGAWLSALPHGDGLSCDGRELRAAWEAARGSAMEGKERGEFTKAVAARWFMDGEATVHGVGLPFVG